MSHDHWVRVGLVLWIVFGLVIGALALLWPFTRSLTPDYVHAVIDFWLSRVEPPDAAEGFYYLPASRVLFSPFAFAGVAVGGLLWRLFAYGLLTLAAWCWANLLAPQCVPRAFVMILVLMLPTSAGVLRNGQFDAHCWALMALGAAAVAIGGWWRAASALGLALALKPTAIVAVLLIGVTWPPVGIRLLPIIIATLAIPYVNPNWTYVEQLYADWLGQLLAALPHAGRWNDLANAFSYLGYAIPYELMTVIRIIAAIVTLAFALVAARRLPRIEAAFVVLMLTAVYLLLFNPRTEGSSYVGLAIVAAPIAARLALVEQRRGWSAAVAALAIMPGLIGLTALSLRLFNLWLDPLLASIFLVGVLIPRGLSSSVWGIGASPPKQPDRWQLRG